MKKMFLATCLLAASAFAAPAAEDVKPAATNAEVTAPAAQPAAEAVKTEAKAPVAEAVAQPAAETVAAPTATPAAQVAEQPVTTEPAPTTEAAAAVADSSAPVANATPAEVVTPAEAVDSTAEAAKAEATAAETTEAEVASAKDAKTDSVKADAPEAKNDGFVEIKHEQVKAKSIKRKKKKLIENAMFETPKLAFDVMADFELEAGKVFWNSEDDENGDNLETWNGEANFAILAEGDDFKGKLAVAFYPGDLQASPEGYTTKRQKRAMIRNDSSVTTVDDFFSLDEAWAFQETEHFNFKVGRWDNTDKSGDYFGGYIDGYRSGFMSSQDAENQLQFGFTPSENVAINLSLISSFSHLDKGDLRAAFNFHGLEGISDLKVQLAYRSNLFDVIYDSDAKIRHNASIKANLPIIQNYINIFAEAALMNIDPDEDMIIPVTGGFAFNTPVVDRIILEAEYVGERSEHLDVIKQDVKTKHVKDVLGALYIEKAFTDRFSLSAGFHSYGFSKDFMLSGNLVGRIN